MRRILALCLGGVFLLGGCPSQDYPAVNEVLTAGDYAGTVSCTSSITGQADRTVDEPGFSANVSQTGQLVVWGSPYYSGLELSMNFQGLTGSVTINNIDNDPATKTLTVGGDGTLTSGQGPYAATHSVTLVQTDDTHLQIAWVLTGTNAAVASEFSITCGGTLAR